MSPGYVLVLLVVLLATVLFAGLVWAAGDILALFLIAFLLAYLFDPLTVFLCRHHLSRGVAALIVTLGLSVIIGGALVVLGPIVYAQIGEVVEGARTLATAATTKASEVLSPYFPAFKDFSIERMLNPEGKSVEALSAPVAATVLKGGMAVATTLGIALLLPVVMFYLLKDWPFMLESAVNLAPPRQRPVVRDLGREIDRILSGFLHGQAWVCLCVACLYSAGLLAVGLNFALGIGIASGALKFLPYIGTAVGATAALTAAYVQAGWNQWLILGVIGVYLAVEFIESSFISPRIIGSRVRMAPALVIFAVLLGAKLLGVIGVFLAVPIFAVGRTLLTFWLDRNRIADRSKTGRRHRGGSRPSKEQSRVDAN